MKNHLLIDGNYFAHRVLHGIRIADKNFNLTTPQQRHNYVAALNGSIYNTFSSFNNDYHQLIDNMIFVFDCDSWRKTILPYRPYYIDEMSLEPIDYKGNRTKKKEESEIDYDMMDICIEKFHSQIVNDVLSFRIPGAEGDDSLLLLKARLKALGISTWMMATDGDLEQLVDNACSLLKNSKSKEHPYGQIFISAGNYNKHFNKSGAVELSALEIMTGGAIDQAYFKNMWSFSFNGAGSKSMVERKPGHDIVPAKPALTGLVKTICGDKKDNIFPLFRWMNSTGSRNMSVTEKMIEKALNKIGKTFDEATAVDMLQDKKQLINLLVALKNQIGIDCEIASIGRHFNHNFKLIMLIEDFLPEHVVANFDNYFNSVKDRIIKGLEGKDLLNLAKNSEVIDDAKDLLMSSLPTTEQLAAGEKVENVNQSLIDDILNS